MQVFVVPPNESDNKRVSLESLYGMNEVPSTRALITRPSVSSDLLMFPASAYALERASKPDLVIDSEPARSTKCNLEIFMNSIS